MKQFVTLATIIFMPLVVFASNPTTKTFRATVATKSINNAGSTVYSNLNYFYSRYGKKVSCSMSAVDLISYKNDASGDWEYQLANENYDSEQGSTIQCSLSANILIVHLLPPESDQCSFKVTGGAGGVTDFSGGCMSADGKTLPYTGLEISSGKSSSDVLVPLEKGNLRLLGMSPKK